MTHKDFKAMEIYNQISALEQNNIKGRYDKKIAKLQKELDEILNELDTSNLIEFKPKKF